MITAKIGNATLKLETLKDAESLIDIVNRAQLIEKTYGLDYRDFFYVSENEKRISIEITESPTIHTLEQFQKMEETRALKAAEKSASATVNA